MKIKALILAALLPLSAFGQSNPFIKGDLTIRFDSRLKPGVENVSDKYTYNINVANSSIFRGSIESFPFIDGLTSAKQQGRLVYAVETDIVNPNNPAQTKNVGQIIGTVPVSDQNVYDFTAGSAKISVFGAGKAGSFESKVAGQAFGKPPAKTGMFSKLKQDALKLVNSKGNSISVTKYDKMEFVNLILPAGPVAIYQEVSLNGSMIYDYARSAWHFQNLIVIYSENGRRMQDNLTGNIRWVKNAYEFDIKVNEPPPSETAVFAAASDEAAFFAADDTTPTLSGTMKYKDTESLGKVVSSNISVDLVGNKLTKQQVMYLFKTIFLVAVVPVNAE